MTRQNGTFRLVFKTTQKPPFRGLLTKRTKSYAKGYICQVTSQACRAISACRKPRRAGVGFTTLDTGVDFVQCRRLQQFPSE